MREMDEDTVGNSANVLQEKNYSGLTPGCLERKSISYKSRQASRMENSVDFGVYMI